MNIFSRTNTINFTLLIFVILLAFLLLFYDLGSSNLNLILLQIRLPRLLSAASVAVILSLSGMALQALFKNDLAEPGVLGISSGGTLGAVFGIFIFSLLKIQMPYFTLPLFSIFFSFLSIYLVLKLSGKNPYNALIILLGVAINSFNGSFITLISYLSADNSLRNIIFWGMGSFTNTNITTSLLLTILATVLMVVYTYRYKMFNALRLDNENLYYAGHNIKKIQLFIIISVTITVGCSVAFCGLISFVGLVAPHIARLLVGFNHKNVAITAPLVAVVLVLTTDFICKNLLYPVELPTSVITSFIGAPYFIHLIFRQKRKHLEY